MAHKALALGDKIEITKTRFNTNKTYKNDKKYISIIQDIDEDEIVISAPIENGKIIPLEIGSSYILDIYTSGGLFKCKASVARRYKKNNLYFIVFEIKSEMVKSQRRQYYRLSCVLPIAFTNIQEDNWYEGLIIDISGGGLRFNSKYKIDINDELKCKIKLDINNVVHDIEVKGRVILSQIIDFETMRYETRIKFYDIFNEDREKIIKFIFEEDRKRRKRRKGL
ncbi:MAG: flagellar brake protein [Vallitalea sp.]|jgi:c-di-GMP-binding flagellar brake protein YcgR|nr:flagellar brake protein [Vallitalea sp.]